MSAGKVICIVEDDLNMRDSLRRAIQHDFQNYTIILYENGEQVITALEHSKPDLFILDIMMPKVNGLQLLKFIKQHKDTEMKKVPVIILTAVGNREVKQKALQLGAQDFIVKPVNKKILCLKVKNILGGS